MKNDLNETSLHIAIIKENIDIIKLLLSNEKIDVNILYVEGISN